MHVVIVSDYAYVNGGAARVAILSARGLAERGVQVTFFAGEGQFDEQLRHCSIELAATSDSKSGAITRFWNRRAKEDLDRILSKLPRGQAVLHVHAFRDVLSNSVLKSAFEAGVPVVITCHEYGLACPYAGFFDHRRNEICTREPLSASCLFAHCNRKGYDKKLWTFARGYVQNGRLRLPERASDVVFVSGFSRERLEPFVGEGVRRHTIANPVAAAAGQKSLLGSGSPFLFVGLLTPGKDPVLTAQAAAKAGVPIRFVGDGELRDEVLAANPNAEITGWLDAEGVRNEMMKARAIVLPARWYETQGLVIQEGAACGVPAIVSRTSAASEFVSDGTNGILIDAGNVDQLSDAMKRLSDKEIAHTMGEAAYAKFWSDPPTIEKHVSAILKVYEGAIG